MINLIRGVGERSEQGGKLNKNTYIMMFIHFLLKKLTNTFKIKYKNNVDNFYCMYVLIFVDNNCRIEFIKAQK